MSSCFIISDVVSEYPNFKADLGFQNLPTMLGEEARVTSGRPSQPGPAACMHERPQDPPPSRLCPSPSSGSAARCSDPRPRFHGPALRESHSSMLLCECSPPSPLRTGLHVPGTSLLIGEDLAPPAPEPSAKRPGS